MYTIMAMDLLGYAADHPDRAEAENQFANLMVDDGERFFFQPCFSVVWDTAIACHALGESGMAAPERLTRAGEWLLTKEVRRKGDWSVKRPNVEPSGWYFEFANEHYPDIDDTAMVLLGLQDAACGKAAAIKRAVDWLLAMQSSDGGWAAFDVDNNWQFLSDVPFADHNAMLDPTCPDITGRVVEALTLHGVRADHPAIRKGVAYLERAQEADGSWQGRWGVNYIYGTCFAVRGLRAAGESDREVSVLRAGEWLRSIQNADGGWGESPESAPGERVCAGAFDAFADGVGGAGLARERGYLLVERAAGRGVPDSEAERRWHVERRGGDGYGLPERVLSAHITCTGTRSRCWRWRRSSKQSVEAGTGNRGVGLRGWHVARELAEAEAGLARRRAAVTRCGSCRRSTGSGSRW
jgi:hypothetical protein